MLSSIIFFYLFSFLLVSPAEAQLNSCGNLGRIGCIGSCVVQNCATGSCEKRKGASREICVCARCAQGPVQIPIPGGKGK